MAAVDKNGEETVELMESFETDGEPAQASPRKVWLLDVICENHLHSEQIAWDLRLLKTTFHLP